MEIVFLSSLFIKPLILILWLSLLFSFLGILVLIKRMSFYSDGIAHASIFSLAIAYLLNLDFLLLGILGVILFSSLIYLLERKTSLHPDALISLIFVSFLSLGLILISLKPGYQPQLLGLFIGNVLTFSDFDFYLMLILSSIILIFLVVNFSKLMLIFVDPTEAFLRGLKNKKYEYIFYIILGITTILGIKIMGVVLVTSFLILPPMIASLLSKSLKMMIILTLFLGFSLTLGGFIISFIFNLPLSASIVLFQTFIFYLIFAVKLFLLRN